MTRMALAAAWVWFALAEPAWALAPALEPAELSGGHDTSGSSGSADVAPAARVAVCMCADHLELGFTPKSNDAAPQNETIKPAPHTFALADSALPPLEDNPIAWCVSPDDPRCAPRDAGSPSDPNFAQLQLSPSGSVELPDMRTSGVRSVTRFWQLGAARPGIRDRVERPPR